MLSHVSPTLNVVLPANIQTGFADSNLQTHPLNLENYKKSKIQIKKRKPRRRVKSAIYRRRGPPKNQATPHEISAGE